MRVFRESRTLICGICQGTFTSARCGPITANRRTLANQSYADRLQKNPLTCAKSFINGSWVDSAGGKSFEVIDPATGGTLSTVPDMTAVETAEAIRAANEAQTQWGQTDLNIRSDYLKRLNKLIRDNTESLAEIMTLEAGKPLAESKGEVMYANSFLEWFAEEARRISGLVSLPHKNNTRALTIRQPVGVCGLITPWNFPLAMITRKAAAAIAAGCSVVIKPAEDTPLTALALAKLVEQVKLPPGVFNVVTTSRDNVTSVGRELCENELVRKISFTGSTDVGKKLYEMSASTVKRVSLELGGNAPFIVFDSADVPEAVAGVAASKFRNSGQTCVCPNRILVQHKVYDEFCQLLAKTIKSMKIGHGLDPRTTHGPLINEKATDKVWAHVEDAINKGARLEAGGKKADYLGPCFFEPTLLTYVDKQALVNSQETFGPLAAVTRFETEEEAVSMANNVRVGLAGYFYSNDASQIFRVSESLEVGMVGVNVGVFSADTVAFGGIKESGIGREGSIFGIEEYQELKYIHLNL